MSFLSQPVTFQSLFGKDRKIGSITVQVVLEERTTDVLTITKQPVQQGASITDHAYKEPTSFSMSILQKDNNLISGLLSTFSGNSLAKLYDEFLQLQNSRIPFVVITRKRIYRDVLIASMALTTDKATENCLALNITFQEVLIVNVVTTQVPRSRQKLPGDTGATQNAGKKSALQSLKEGIGAILP